MDTSDDSDDQSPFWIDDFDENKVYFPPTPQPRKYQVIEGDLCKIIRYMNSGKSVNKLRTRCNFSSVHIAVVWNNLETLDHLLTKEDVEVDARCSKGRTPLHLATIFGRVECVLKLIQAGCDINATDNSGNTALHESVCSSVCHHLQQSPQVVSNYGRGDILSHRLDILHILLYHNADVNISNDKFVPFFRAFLQRNQEAQEVLLDYVDDFNRIYHDCKRYSSLFGFMLRKKSPFVKDIIERGADVNYGDDPRVEIVDCAFPICMYYKLDLSTFKMVWERLQYNDVKNTIDLLNFLNYDDAVPTFLQVIIDNDNFETAVQFFSKGENYFLFVNKFAAKKFNFDQLTALTCRLLEHGFRASSYDIHAIFSHYGYCELFRILLYMDNDYSRGWLPHMAFSRLMCDIDYNLKSVTDEINDIPKETVLQLLEFSVHPRLINALSVHYSEDKRMSAILGSLQRVPSLIDLARNSARK